MLIGLRRRSRRLISRHLPSGAKRLIRRVVPATPRPSLPATRTFDLRLPAPPVPGKRLIPSTIRIEAPSGLYVPRLLEASGFAGYEPDATACFLAAIDEVEATAAFDIGANVGVFAVLAAAVTSADVTGFEPTPDIAAAFGRPRSTCRARPTARTRCGLAFGRPPEPSRSRSSGSTPIAPGGASSPRF
jgi:hypothetical protein